MLKKLSLSNFKSFKEMSDLDLKPLTVIVGKNSCGKSSILQSLLLLKQTLLSQSDMPLCLDGKYLRLSNLKEITYGLPPVNSAKIGYELLFENNKKSWNIKLSFKNKKIGNVYKIVLDERVLKSLHDDDELNLANLTKSSLSRRLSKFNFSENQGKLVNFEIVYVGFIPKLIEVTFELKNLNHRIILPISVISKFDNEISLEINKTITNIKYLSPVRAIPERAYMHYSNDVTELNQDGSNSAHILWSKQNELVLWNKNKIKLKDAVNECLVCMGLNQSICPDRVGDILYKIGISENNSGHSVSLADVGFGYSQILPVVLLGLLNKNNGLILLEQPEIHLHPSSAANLADLFLNFIKEGNQFVIETHSQEMINRLRLRVIEDPSLKDKINIVFVESNKELGAQIRQFSIDENGMFPEWPDGFLDESQKLAQAILEARLSRG